MGVWSDQLVPRATHVLLGTPSVRRLRDEAVGGVRGAEVLEIGFGSGPNVALYPRSVARVLAVEPSAVARRLAERRLAAVRPGRGAPRVDFVAADAEDLDLEPGSVDAAVSTFTLCTVRDVRRALGELHRVLRPGGRLHFAEHGLSPDERIAAWQRRLTPLQQRVAAGCRLDRDIGRMLTEAGFALEGVHVADLPAPRALRPWLHVSVGTARKPAGAGPPA